jgi:hypothetical protein
VPALARVEQRRCHAVHASYQKSEISDVHQLIN